MFPLFVNLTDRLAVVIGGGTVGQRKASKLLTAGARVRLVCLEPQPATLTHPALEWVQEPFRPGHLEGAVLVVAAASPEVNTAVVQAAQARGVWVNNASAAELGDCHFPACVQRGEVQVAISTGGRVPAVARGLSCLLDRWLDQAVGDYVGLVADLRPLVRLLPRARARQCWSELGDPHWIDRVREMGTEAVRAEMCHLIEQMARADNSTV